MSRDFQRWNHDGVFRSSQSGITDRERYELEFYSRCDFHVSRKWSERKENKWKIRKGISHQVTVTVN